MDGFNDLLEEIRKIGGPLMWASQKKDFLENSTTYRLKRTAEQLKQDVLHSSRLRHVIDQIVVKTNSSHINVDLLKKEPKVKSTLPMVDVNNETNKAIFKLKREDVEKEAKKILDEMAHEFDLKYVRLLGYILMKVFSKIYQHIYFNSDMHSNLQVIKQHPTLLLPLHRSYMDFLIVSIICFHKNIQLPAIAAGQDFLGLSFLSKMIRHCGAFFIRRSFGSDELYWAIFHQYVQEHLYNCDRPLEFFIEGMRSRTSKSLQPKQGMLSTCLELYMKGHRVEDIYIIPISLNYERLLEEILYSNELLGIPKPKESVGGLVKARSILNQTYGSIFVNFARPISVREMLSQLEGPTLKNRLSHTLTPGFIFELNQKQSKTIESLSYLVLIDMLRNQVIQPISIISTCLLLSFENSSNKKLFEWRRAISLQKLCNQIEILKRTLNNLGAKVYWPLNASRVKCNPDEDEATFEMNKIKNLVLDNIEVHSNLFDIYDRNDPNPFQNYSDKFEFSFKMAREQSIRTNSFMIAIKQPHNQANLKSNLEKIESCLFESSSLYIAMCSYRNQLVHFLIRIALVSNCLLASSAGYQPSESQKILGDLSERKAFEIYKFLTTLFNREFIFHSIDDQKDFNDAVSYLLHTNLLKIVSTEGNERKFELVTFNLKQFLFFPRLFQYIMQNYFEIYANLIKNPTHLKALPNNPSDLIYFDDEKAFTKSIQQKIFDKMLKEVRSDIPSPALSENYLFDFEVLSLNLISNSVLALRQFNILNRCDQFKRNAQTNLSKNGFEIDLSSLFSLNERLLFIIKTNRYKINALNSLFKSFQINTLKNNSDSDSEFDYDFDYLSSDSNDVIKYVNDYQGFMDLKRNNFSKL